MRPRHLPPHCHHQTSMYRCSARPPQCRPPSPDPSTAPQLGHPHRPGRPRIRLRCHRAWCQRLQVQAILAPQHRSLPSRSNLPRYFERLRRRLERLRRRLDPPRRRQVRLGDRCRYRSRGWSRIHLQYRRHFAYQIHFPYQIHFQHRSRRLSRHHLDRDRRHRRPRRISVVRWPSPIATDHRARSVRHRRPRRPASARRDIDEAAWPAAPA